MQAQRRTKGHRHAEETLDRRDVAGVLVAGNGARSKVQGFGLGVIIGEPTGLSAKDWTSKTTALDLAAAWSFSHDSAFHLHGDLVWHPFDLIKVSEGQLPFY